MIVNNWIYPKHLLEDQCTEYTYFIIGDILVASTCYLIFHISTYEQWRMSKINCSKQWMHCREGIVIKYVDFGVECEMIKAGCHDLNCPV